MINGDNPQKNIPDLHTLNKVLSSKSSQKVVKNTFFGITAGAEEKLKSLLIASIHWLSYIINLTWRATSELLPHHHFKNAQNGKKYL